MLPNSSRVPIFSYFISFSSSMHVQCDLHMQEHAGLLGNEA
uniref:Uncharacterized protein n=1 Tax=Rhizophora mucronata TaxID=61149 RepID=A0A2P2QQ51_RHIMU